MITISSELSLIYFDQNVNGTNLICEDGENIKLLLKDTYIHFFENIANDLKTKTFGKFTKCWIGNMEKIIPEVDQVINDFTAHHNIKFDKDDVDRIHNKFRGNVAEILLEKLIIEKRLPFVDGDYIPVDPTRERYSDGQSTHTNTGLPVDFQVKNYSEGYKVKRETFVKCSDTTDEHIHGPEAIIPRDRILDYLDTPHQVIFSLTDAEDLLKEQYLGRVYFFGPKEIDALGIQGNAKQNIKGLYRWFEKIVEEIKTVK